MNFERFKNRRKKSCQLRSECKANANKRFNERLFAGEWNYFVVKNDQSAGNYQSLLECCGRLREIGTNCPAVPQ